MSISIFETRSLMNIVKYTHAVKTPFLSMFFSGKPVISNNEFIDIDFVRGTRKLAPYVGSNMQGKTINKKGFERRTVRPPYIKIKDVTTAEDSLNVLPGQHIYQGNMTASQKARIEIAEQLKDFMDMIERRLEYEAHRSLTTLGDITFTGEGINLTVNYNMKSTHKIALTGTALWTDASSDPSKDLKTWALLIKKDSGVAPDRVVLDTTAGSLYINHDKVISNLDTRRADRGDIKPGTFGDGVQYLGYDRYAGVDVFEYSEQYESDAGVVTPIMTDGSALMGYSKAKTKVHYGAIKDLEVGTASVKHFSKSWVEKDPSVRLLLLQTAPLVAPHQIDCFVSATVV